MRKIQPDESARSGSSDSSDLSGWSDLPPPARLRRFLPNLAKITSFPPS